MDGKCGRRGAVRPRNEILQVLGSRLDLTRTGRMLQVPVMFWYGMGYPIVVWIGTF